MIVPVDDILTLISKELSGLRFIPIRDVEVKVSETKTEVYWEKGKVIPPKTFQELKKIKIKSVDIHYTHSLYEYLCTFCPDSFRIPSAVKSFIEIDKIISSYEALNRTTKRKRSLSIMREIYDRSDDFEPIIRFNETLDYRKWNLLKRDIKKETSLPVLYNEIGIIIFVDLTRKTSNYINRFKKNADLCTLLTQRKSDYAEFQVAPEFNQIKDIWAVNEPNKLLETYIENSPKLIIVGDTIDEKYKSALLEVKRYDRYARFLVITDISPSESKNLLLKIKRAYNTNNYKIE